VAREGVGAGGEMTQAFYAHMNNKTIFKIHLFASSLFSFKPLNS
jgi:hypothetical protein